MVACGSFWGVVDHMWEIVDKVKRLDFTFQMTHLQGIRGELLYQKLLYEASKIIKLLCLNFMHRRDTNGIRTFLWQCRSLN